MPWDCFCPTCGSVVVGSMTDDSDEMAKEMAAFSGKPIKCNSCGCIFNFDTGEPLACDTSNLWNLGWL